MKGHVRLALGLIVGLWLSIIGVEIVIGIATGSRVLTLAATGVTYVLAMSLLNWNCVAPQTWFRTHRWLYEHAAQTGYPGYSYYGEHLPLMLRPLTVDGRVSSPEGSILFFPLWIGIPDDAGGYFRSPDRSPEGFDMYGFRCQEPVDLGDGWWMCGVQRGLLCHDSPCGPDSRAVPVNSTEETSGSGAAAQQG